MLLCPLVVEPHHQIVHVFAAMNLQHPCRVTEGNHVELSGGKESVANTCHSQMPTDRMTSLGGQMRNPFWLAPQKILPLLFVDCSFVVGIGSLAQLRAAVHTRTRVSVRSLSTGQSVPLLYQGRVDVQHS